MIRHIAGTVSYIGSAAIVVDVAGVGYLLYVSRPHDFTLDTTVKLHTHQAVRETALDLYGFTTLDELEVFELLLTLPKIGPKSAAAVLAQADIELLQTAVLNDDAAHLSKLSGIGKKTAEKIVAGLKDIFADRGIGVPVAGASTVGGSDFQADAIDALVALGYPHVDARRIVQSLPPTVTNTNEAITAALRSLGTT